MSKVLKTKYGTAKVQSHGYYVITSTKEGNNGEYLHKLIWIEHNGPVPDGDYIIHHIDDNKLNNDINNLELKTRPEHTKHHHKGKIGYWKGKTLSEEHCKKLSESKTGEKNGMWNKHHTEESRRKMSESQKGNKNRFNSCLKIKKEKNKNYKQGFTWRAYPYNHNGKLPSISNVDLEKCIETVEKFLKSDKNTLGYISYKVIGDN